MSKAMTREEAKERFWRDVKDLLTDQYRHRDQQAEEGIDRYRQEANERLGEVVYNQGEEQTAKVIDRIIREGRKDRRDRRKSPPPAA